MTGLPAAAEAKVAGPRAMPVARRHQRVSGPVNWMGVQAHVRRGVMVFLKEGLSEIGGPLVTSAMFLAVFVLAMAGDAGPEARQALTDFVGPGIAAYMMVHYAFQHAAVLLIADKAERTIEDFLMAPLSAAEVMAGYVASAVLCALLIGFLVLALMVVASGVTVERPLALFGFALLGALLFSLVGALIGLWAEKWEQYSAAESFLILPMGVLSGAFFQVEQLDTIWRWAIAANPFYYIVDSIRWAATGTVSVAPLLSAGITAALIVLVGALTLRLFAMGYHLRP